MSQITTNHNGRYPYILGLDLGVRSVGWSIIRVELGEDEEESVRASRVVTCASRVFEAGVEGDIEQGRDSSRAVERRQKRQERKQHWRRQWRQGRVFRILQHFGMMPACNGRDPEARHEALLALDGELRAKFLPERERVAYHTLPYLLRAKALDEKLELMELGRAIYHLSQRRGFLSNRKAELSEKEEERSVVYGGINQLTSEIAESGAQTLGEYFSTLDPEETRIRARWTARSMYKDEFNQMWEAQAKHYSEILTTEFRDKLENAIFRQRPLKSAAHLIGKCSLEKGRQRCAMALPCAQRFRYLQKVNDLLIVRPDTSTEELSEEQRGLLIDALEKEGDRTFNQIRKLLELDKRAKEDRKKSNTLKADLKLFKYTFNFEEGGEKSLIGNRTNEKMIAIFGEEKWLSIPDEDQDEIVRDVLNYVHADALKKRAMKAWGLDAEQAGLIAKLKLEPGHARISKVAIDKLLPGLWAGEPFATVRRRIYPETVEAEEAVNELPPVLSSVEDLRNPAVCRALTEMRKVVNGIIRKYGKPALIRVELARDLKKPRKKREEISKRNKANRKGREDAKKRILKEVGIEYPSREDIEKVLLADECDWICPYTGKSICWKTLLGAHPQFDIEHIIPRSISLDNTFVNKTLCYHEVNRNRKRNMTPYEAFSQNETEWNEILQRVKRFTGNLRDVKLKRFKMNKDDVAIAYGDFTERHLRDTAYISRLATEYLGLLYGGLIDDERKRRVQTSPGMLTSLLRGKWGLNAILSSDGVKNRNDHRHHAIDAIVVALTDVRTVQQISKAMGQSDEKGMKKLATIDLPYDGLVEDARAAIERAVVSHRVDHRIAGALHAETIYGKEHADGKTRKKYRHQRKALVKLTDSDLKKGMIVDPVIRKLVTEKWQALGGGKPDKIFADASNHPYMTAKDGRKIPIHAARVKVSKTTKTVGKGVRKREVASGKDSNHHTVITEVHDRKKGKVWEDHPVDRLTVVRELGTAKREGRKPVIVKREWGLGRKFVMWLCKGDCIEMDDKDGDGRSIYVVRKFSKGDINLKLHNDARTVKVLNESGDGKKFRITRITELRERHAQKVTISPLGEVFHTND